MRLFPTPGTLGTAAGRLALLQPILTGNLATLAPDLLAALCAYAQGSAALRATVPGPGGGVNLATDLAGATAPYPALLIHGYEELDPGETLDDVVASLTLSVYHTDLDSLRTVSSIVKTALDTAAINPQGTRTIPLVWANGTEVGVVRHPSQPYRLPGQHASAQFVWREDIGYEFWTAQTIP